MAQAKAREGPTCAVVQGQMAAAHIHLGQRAYTLPPSPKPWPPGSPTCPPYERQGRQGPTAARCNNSTSPPSKGALPAHKVEVCPAHSGPAASTRPPAAAPPHRGCWPFWSRRAAVASAQLQQSSAATSADALRGDASTPGSARPKRQKVSVWRSASGGLASRSASSPHWAIGAGWGGSVPAERDGGSSAPERGTPIFPSAASALDTDRRGAAQGRHAPEPSAPHTVTGSRERGEDRSTSQFAYVTPCEVTDWALLHGLCPQAADYSVEVLQHLCLLRTPRSAAPGNCRHLLAVSRRALQLTEHRAAALRNTVLAAEALHAAAGVAAGATRRCMESARAVEVFLDDVGGVSKGEADSLANERRLRELAAAAMGDVAGAKEAEASWAEAHRAWETARAWEALEAPPPLPAKKLVDWRHVGALQSAELCNLPPGAAAALIGAARESAVLGDVDAAPAEAWARGSQRVRLQQMVVAVQACLQLARHGLQHAEVAAGGAAQAARQACETARNLFEDVAVMRYSVEQMLVTGASPRQLALQARPQSRLDVSLLRKGLFCSKPRGSGAQLCGLIVPNLVINVPPQGGALQRERRSIIKASEAMTQASVVAMQDRWHTNRQALGLA